MPKSFLVKKPSRNKRKERYDDNEELSDVIEEGEPDRSPESSITGLC